MNRKIKLRKDVYILFFINILILFLLIIFNMIFVKYNYSVILRKIMLILNVLVLLSGIIINIILVIKKINIKESKIIKIIIVFFICFILINSFGTYFVNKIINNHYNKISNKLLNYCKLYDCKKYETINKGYNKEFVMYRTYYDYNKNENEIILRAEYSTKKIIKVSSVIYLDNELFSADLIKEQLDDFYKNFNKELSKDNILIAFEKRFTSAVRDDGFSYKVEEIYKDNYLHKIKVIISFDIY